MIQYLLGLLMVSLAAVWVLTVLIFATSFRQLHHLSEVQDVCLTFFFFFLTVAAFELFNT